MKPMHIVAEQTNEELVLWNTEDDRWSRRAKHPLRVNEVPRESTIIWEQGDMALYKSHPVEVTVPSGPNGTIGIIYEGQTKMVLKSRLTKIDESVFGNMQAILPINRMMQLAGISTPQIMTPTDQIADGDSAVQLTEDTGTLFDQLYKTNFAGQYRNNPTAAQVATIGQIMIGLQGQMQEIQDKLPPDLATKLQAAVGIGAALINAAKAMTQDK